MKLRAALLVMIVLVLVGGMGFLAARVITQRRPEPSATAAVGGRPSREIVREGVGPLGAGALAASLASAAPSPQGGEGLASAANRAGIAALEAGELERAIELFEECLEREPDERAFRFNLAQALARLALRERAERPPPCEECTEALGRALELTPERDDLRELHQRWLREDGAHADLWRDSSLHFDLSYDGSKSDLLHGAHRLLAELERAYVDFGELFVALPVEEGRPRIQVVLYDREQFGSVTGLDDWAGGAFDGTVRIPVEDLAAEEARLRSVLRHELAHAFVREVGGPRVPGWLNEGVAQWLEGDTARAVARARARLSGAALFPLDQLGGTLAAWKDREAIALAYAQSLAFCAHLADAYGERIVVHLVKDCAEGSTPEETFRRLLGFDLAAALTDLGESLR